MDKLELYEKADELKQVIGEETLLQNLMMAMSQNELEKCLKYIDTAFEADVFN